MICVFWLLRVITDSTLYVFSKDGILLNGSTPSVGTRKQLDCTTSECLGKKGSATAANSDTSYQSRDTADGTHTSCEPVGDLSSMFQRKIAKWAKVANEQKTLPLRFYYRFDWISKCFDALMLLALKVFGKLINMFSDWASDTGLPVAHFCLGRCFGIRLALEVIA